LRVAAPGSFINIQICRLQQVEQVLADTFASGGLRLMSSAEVARLKSNGRQRTTRQSKLKAPATAHASQDDPEQGVPGSQEGGYKGCQEVRPPGVISKEVQDMAKVACLKHLLH
jgi:hypothetical protein